MNLLFFLVCLTDHTHLLNVEEENIFGGFQIVPVDIGIDLLVSEQKIVPKSGSIEGFVSHEDLVFVFELFSHRRNSGRQWGTCEKSLENYLSSYKWFLEPLLIDDVHVKILDEDQKRIEIKNLIKEYGDEQLQVKIYEDTNGTRLVVPLFPQEEKYYFGYIFTDEGRLGFPIDGNNWPIRTTYFFESLEASVLYFEEGANRKIACLLISANNVMNESFSIRVRSANEPPGDGDWLEALKYFSWNGYSVQKVFQSLQLHLSRDDL